MNFEYPYKLSKEEARERLEALGEYLHNRHNIRPTWDGDTATIRGKYMVVKIEGKLELDDGMVRFNGKDPGMLWRKKAVKYLTGKLDVYLDPNKPVASLPRG
ncbi:MAG: polyhydroxyalkanoic acid system family protein [Deltaproteobacteria bacterium]|jgi:hypothetical protein|nr:polyhydroxyalkanoic acid system family protein [Deltaproteobacteria bacterium]